MENFIEQNQKREEEKEESIEYKTSELTKGLDEHTIKGIKDFISGFEQKIKEAYIYKKTTEEREIKIREIIRKFKNRIDNDWTCISSPSLPFHYSFSTVISPEKREIAKSLLDDIVENIKKEEFEKEKEK